MHTVPFYMLFVLQTLLPMPPSNAATAAQHGADSTLFFHGHPERVGVLDVEAVISELVVGGMPYGEGSQNRSEKMM